jgi:hypothetical protein
MSGRTSANTLNVGDVVVVTGALGGPAMRVTGFGYVDQGTCRGASAKLESLRRDEKEPLKPAWMAEFLVSCLRVLPEGNPASVSPFYDFGSSGRQVSDRT